ncbi:bleomycin resistance protein [Kinneretia aquatilis]|nr:VOC family protein [Paucibacter aquatile]
MNRCAPTEPFWNPMVPELAVSDLAASLHFYRACGFEVRFRRDDPPFAYLELGRAQLMLEQDHAHSWLTAPTETPRGRGMNLQIEVEDVEQLQAQLRQFGCPLFRALEESWYPVSEREEEGQLEFLVQDLDGYLLRFCQVLGSRERPSPGEH